MQIWGQIFEIQELRTSKSVSLLVIATAAKKYIVLGISELLSQPTMTSSLFL